MATKRDFESLLVPLVSERDALMRAWSAVVSGASRGRVSQAEAEKELAALYGALLSGLQAGARDVDDGRFDELRAMLNEYSQTRARHGFTPSETAVAVFGLKTALLEVLADSDDATKAAFAPFSLMIDDLGLLTFETFVQAREAVIVNQSEQLLELSTPVVKLWEGVLAVPLIGTLDSARTQVVMESLLETLVATESTQAIIDITGVPAVDTQVAQHLLKTVVAARLMGADCVISGIRPQIAQTIVALGVEFGDIPTKATLADALRLTLARMGVEIHRTRRGP